MSKKTNRMMANTLKKLAFGALVSVVPMVVNAAEKLTTDEIRSLLFGATVRYDYGGFNAFAFTSADGDNFFDMNGHKHRFGASRDIVRTQAVVKDGQVCFHSGWVVCWYFTKTNKQNVFFGRDVQDDSLIAVTYKLGPGDMRRITRRYHAQFGS